MRTVKDLMRLDGRVAVVTGGAGHIGSAIAEALAEAGASIVLVDRDTAELPLKARALSDRCASPVDAIPVDLLDEAAVRALPTTVVKRAGCLDILFNCAAFVGTTAYRGWAERFENQGSAAWRAALEVNLTAPFELVQAALPHLRASGKGSIINVASIYGMVGPDWSLYEGTSMANPAAYGASKGGLLQLTRWLATTIGPDVRVNALSPGGVARNQPNAFVERYVSRTPLRRMAAEEDFKGAAVFLASDMSAYVTGQNIVVDGGWCCW